MEDNEAVVQEVDNVGPIQRYYHEQEVSRLERHNKRLWITLLVTLFFLVATNAAWIWHESQFEDTVVTQDVDTGEGSAYITGVGDVYGTSQADGQGQTP